MIRAWLVVAVALLVACTDPDRFSLQVTWSQGPEQQCPVTEAGSTSCAAIARSCGATGQLRIVDAADDTRVYYQRCFEIAPGDDMCGLRNFAIDPDTMIPNQMVRIQFLVWSNDALVAAGYDPPTDCPSSGRFDALGFPQQNVDLQPPLPVPALGREIYFPVGDREIATVELGCSDLAQLDTNVCRNASIDVDARVLVPGGWREVTASEAAPLKVALCNTRERAGDTQIDPTTVQELALSLEPGPHWTREVVGPIDGVRCLQIYEVVAGAIPIAVCQPAVVTAGGLPMVGYRPDESLVARVIDLINEHYGTKGFPLHGVVLGFVIDRDNQPVVGATVVPTAGTVLYPNLTLDDLDATATSGAGLFVSTDVPIGGTWDATAGALVDDGTAEGGVIASHVSVVVVRMVAP